MVALLSIARHSSSLAKLYLILSHQHGSALDMSLEIWEKRVFTAIISMKNPKRRREGLGNEERGWLLFQGDE